LTEILHIHFHLGILIHYYTANYTQNYMNAFKSITTTSRSSLVATFYYIQHVNFIITGLIIEACYAPANGQKKLLNNHRTELHDCLYRNSCFTFLPQHHRLQII